MQRKKGIAVFNVPDVSIDSAAELTIGLLLCISRKVYNAIDAVKKNHWDKTAFTGNQLKGKTIGLVAPGKIGPAGWLNCVKPWDEALWLMTLLLIQTCR